jgi:hypothetical protein
MCDCRWLKSVFITLCHNYAWDGKREREPVRDILEAWLMGKVQLVIVSAQRHRVRVDEYSCLCLLTSRALNVKTKMLHFVYLCTSICVCICYGAISNHLFILCVLKINHMMELQKKCVYSWTGPSHKQVGVCNFTPPFLLNCEHACGNEVHQKLADTQLGTFQAGLPHLHNSQPDYEVGIRWDPKLLFMYFSFILVII